jgi:AbrB family looped-hinge helix DNA binding protein
MPIAQSKLTAQGQISVPAEIRNRLGLRPGSVLEWDEKGGQVFVRKAGRYTSAQVHEALFEGQPVATKNVDVKAAIRQHVRRRHARG